MSALIYELDGQRAKNRKLKTELTAAQTEVARLTAELEDKDAEHKQALKNLGKVHRVVERLESERDAALARVAAAFEVAAETTRKHIYYDSAGSGFAEGAYDAAIRALAPADASDALNQMLDEAYAAGQERMREAAAQECEDRRQGRPAPYIRALPITPRPDREGRT